MTRDEIAVRLLAGYLSGKAASGFYPSEEHVARCVEAADWLIKELKLTAQPAQRPPPTPMPGGGS